MSNYFGIFTYYHAPKGISRNLLMAGDFTPNDLHIVFLKVQEEFVENKVYYE